MRRLLLSLMIAGAGPAAAAPANLCAELTTFLDQASPASPGGAPQAQAAAPAPGAQVAPQAAPQTEQGGQQGATAVEAANDRAQPGAGGQDASQRTSGMSGPITESGVGASGPQGEAQARSASADGNPKAITQGAEQKPNEGAPPKAPTAPAPAAAAAAKNPLDPAIVNEARTAAGGQDQGACRAATQRLRRAGAVLPAPLLALGALKPELLAGQAPATPAVSPPR